MNDSKRTERFLRACRRESVDATPVWIMRQAGRYLPEYRELRSHHAFLEVARTPELVAQVTLMPIRRFELDAAIIFADIALPLPGVGIDFDLVEKVGPVIDPPIRTDEQVRSLRDFDAERDVPFLLEGIRLVRRELDGAIPLIGFAGAPFTLASYVVEGRARRDFRFTKELMFRHEATWSALMDRLTGMTIASLRAQAAAGAQALQVFDSWVGCLAPEDYRRYVEPHSKRLFRELSDLDVPVIHFGTGTAPFLETFAGAGGDVIGVDWRVPLDEAWRRIGYDRAIQGNLDPCVLLTDGAKIRERVETVLDRAGGRPGHVFNLGHGILPDVPPDNVARLVDAVHERTTG